MKNEFEIFGDAVCIKLTNKYNKINKYTLIDLADISIVASIPGYWTATKLGSRKRWHVIFTRNVGNGFRKCIQLHDLIMSNSYHINNNGLDNRRKNLRCDENKVK